MRSQTISDKTVETVTQFHLHFDTPLLTPPLTLPLPLSQCCWVLPYVLQYISDQDKATLSLGGGERAAFKLNVWISGCSTKKDTLSQQVLSEIVGYYELSKKGFPFFGGCNKKNGAWNFRKDKKNKIKNTLLHPSFPFRSSSTYHLSLFIKPASWLSYYTTLCTLQVKLNSS